MVYSTFYLLQGCKWRSWIPCQGPWDCWKHCPARWVLEIMFPQTLFFSLFQPQTMSCYKKKLLVMLCSCLKFGFSLFFFGLLNYNQIISWLIIIWVGWIVSSLLAGATVGSFTGGSLADKFGRTRTFQLDAVPLAAGAFLWCVLRQLYYLPCFMKANT